jgi:hypothetical protein
MDDVLRSNPQQRLLMGLNCELGAYHVQTRARQQLPMMLSFAAQLPTHI